LHPVLGRWANTGQLAIVRVGSRPTPEIIQGRLAALTKVSKHVTVVVADQDYHHPKWLEREAEQYKREGITLFTWSANEVENLFLEPLAEDIRGDSKYDNCRKIGHSRLVRQHVLDNQTLMDSVEDTCELALTTFTTQPWAFVDAKSDDLKSLYSIPTELSSSTSTSHPTLNNDLERLFRIFPSPAKIGTLL